jgi:HSP20 family molecular chaperone IbpA/RNA polymerase subunit RPABC4/transcription elongation factor Spt4
MLNRTKCNNCNRKIKDSFSFCPHCGIKRIKKENLGLLGKEDLLNPHQNIEIPKKTGIIDSLIGKMMNNAFQMIEKEMKKDLNNISNMPKQNFQLMINGKRVDPATLGFVENKPKKQKETRKVCKPISESKRKKAISLPQKEPKTNVRRFSNKIIYEMEIPGVKSIEDISINQLENSIEIKALASKKAYSKLIPMSLPIRHYFLTKGILTLELESE